MPPVVKLGGAALQRLTGVIFFAYQVSVAALMMGVGGGSDDLRTLLLSGTSGLIGGALSMAAGEYISVYSQRDAEEADIAKEQAAQEHVRPEL